MWRAYLEKQNRTVSWLEMKVGNTWDKEGKEKGEAISAKLMKSLEFVWQSSQIKIKLGNYFTIWCLW